jgi:ABC-2 type transport system permease protein
LNLYAIAAIYRFEMARTFRTLVQSIISPVISTVLYFIVFGAAIGSGIQTIEGIHYSAFIVPGLIMLTVSFYALEMLPSFWQTVTLFNPVMYLISVFRWAFFDVADVPVFHSFLATLVFSITCITIIYWIFKTGYKLKN